MASHPDVLPDSAADAKTPTTRPRRASPRNPSSPDAAPSAAPKATPYLTLLQIPSMPKPATPTRRASSAGPPASHRAIRRTPGTQARTPSTRIGGSARRPTVMTPHGRAAIREVEARRAGFTPGGPDRRRSGWQQRETPRDTLRALSRLLAPKTKPTVPTPPAPVAGTGKVTIAGSEDFDDEEELPRPRLSLPLGLDDEDDSLLEPPRSSGLEDENITVQSVELARRAALERGPGRLSRGSFGSIGMNDQFAELNESGLGSVLDSSLNMGGPYQDDDVLNVDDGIQDDITTTLRDADLGQGRLSLAGSDIRPRVLADDTEDTFVFTIPPRDVLDIQRSDDAIESPLRDSGENNDFGEMDTIVDDNGEGVWDAMQEDVDVSMAESTVQGADITLANKQKAARKKRIKVSKHGIQYPSLPAGVVKKLATMYARTSGNSKTKISKDALDAILQASDWFFEQVSEDLGAYAEHAGRKTIEESDIITLMGRQRQINAATTPFSLAQKFLPRELLQDLRMIPPARVKRGRQLERIGEADDERE